ncbi:hypothetical protein T06_12117, partial [Trichinella sp. T6]
MCGNFSISSVVFTGVCYVVYAEFYKSFCCQLS